MNVPRRQLGTFKNVCQFLSTLSSLINKHAHLLFSRTKIHPTHSYLRPFYRQAAPNFAYSFIKFEEKIPVYLFISAYLFIRELRVSHLNKSVIIDMLLLHTVISLVPKRKSFYKLVCT